ncbi:MFS transporter [Acinetobacter gerneri]|uniref:MFS transporter n=1 Tax=Acinetobacter gerneri TaxID=202952 RepID=UPI003A86DD2C
MNENVRSSSKIVAYLLLILNCLSPMAAIVIAPSLPQMQKYFSNVPNVEFLVPMALTIPGLLVALCSPIVGILSDKFGRKKLLVTATFAYSILGIMPFWLNDLPSIIASRVLLGCAEGVIVTISTTLIGDYYQGVIRQRYLALQTTFASTSAILFFMIGGILGEHGWRIPYVIYIVPVFLAILSLFLLWEPNRHQIMQEDDSQIQPTFRPILLAFICAVTFIGAMSFMVLQIQMAYILGILGEDSPKVAGNIASACSALIVIGTLSIHVLSKLGFRTPHNLFIAFGLIGTSFILISHAQNAHDLLIYSLINGLGCGLLLPTLAIWNMRELPGNKRGMGTGMWYGSYCLGMFFSPIIVVAGSKMVGGLMPMLQTIGIFLIPIALIALILGFVKFKQATVKTVA